MYGLLRRAVRIGDGVAIALPEVVGYRLAEVPVRDLRGGGPANELPSSPDLYFAWSARCIGRGSCGVPRLYLEDALNHAVKDGEGKNHEISALTDLPDATCNLIHLVDCHIVPIELIDSIE
jgi:hypothetical protein